MARRLSFKNYVKTEGGATAVEFALVAGPFFWFFLSMFETGLMLFTDYALQAGTQAAARMVRTGQMQTGSLTVDYQNMNFRQIVCKTAAIIASCETKVSVKVQATAGTLTTFKSTIPNVVDIGPASSGGAATYECSPGKPLENVVVIVTYDWKYFLPFMNAFTNVTFSSPTRRLVGYAMFQNEPYTLTGSVPSC